MSKKDITDLVQRLDAFEERLGVRIVALSAFEVKDEYSDDADITVRGELHAVSGTNLANDLQLQISVYDAAGRVIQTDIDYIDSDSFFGFHTFEIKCSVAPGLAKKIRLVPKPS